MKGDFSRLTFDPKKHYNRVNIQQGRVQVDADWNEQQEIYQHLVETETVDIIGRSGGPMHGAGFLIIPRASTTDVSVLEQELQQADSALRSQTVATGLPNELFISKGGYYVDGILCTNEAVVAYTNQPDFPRAPAITQPGFYLAYLDVWPRHITALEDPHIREVALGGPDTATRLKTVWQVKLLPLPGIAAPVNCQSSTPAWSDLIAPTSARLSARAKPSLLSSDPCVIASGAGYRRSENQLYRVEIHKPGGVGSATFKWSRDNGSVVTGWLDNPGGPLDKVKVGSIGPDQVLGFAGGQWVELTDSEHELRGERGTLVRLVNAEADLLTINPATAAGLPVDRPSFPLNPQVRRWDSEGEIAVSIPTANEGYIALEDGVEVRFDSGPYKTGDYWLIPARTDTADVEWPRRAAAGPPLSLPPHGIQHHYCRLAMLSFNNGAWTVLSDCRDIFPPLTELTSFFYGGGDGQEAMPDSAHPSAPTPLARPLEVGVANGEWPVEGARVRFTVKVGNGTLVPANGLVTTGPKGIASCGWILGRGQTNPPNSQQVEAVLLDDSNNPINTPIHFNANLSVADQVAYNPGQCGSLQGQTTVQSAIERLAALVSLYPVSSDDQSVLPNEQLEPLVVVASSLCGPVDGLNVVFTVVSGGGHVSVPTSHSARGVVPPPTNGGSPPVTVPTDGQGLASCNWTLGSAPSTQVVEAVLQDTAHTVPPIKVRFTARLAGPAEDPGFHVTGLFLKTDVLPGTVLPPLVNDMEVPLAQFGKGLQVECDARLHPSSITGKPVCFVTLEIPFFEQFSNTTTVAQVANTTKAAQASNTTAVDLVPGTTRVMVGFQPVILASHVDFAIGSTGAGGEVIFDRQKLVWTPTPQVSGWIGRLFLSLQDTKIQRLLARLTLKGNFIWAVADPELYLDGEVFGAPHGAAPHDLRLPSGDQRKGGDLEMWFWVTPPISRCKIDPGQLILKATPNNPSPTAIVTITNEGDEPFTLRSVTVTGPSSFSVVNPPTNVLVVKGQPLAVTVQYRRPFNMIGTTIARPIDVADETGSLTFTIDKPPGCPSVELIGRVKVISPVVNVQPTEINLGSVTRLTTAENKIVILNQGDAPLEAKLSTGQPQLKVSPEQVTIDAGGSQTLNVSLVGSAIPADEKAGAKTAAINIASNDPNTPNVAVPMKWNLTIEPVKNPILDLSARQIELGSVTHATTAENKIVILNKGDAPLVANVSTGQPHLKVSPEQVTIDAGGSQTLNVSLVGTAIPADEKAGAKTGAINIASNDPSAPNVSVPVKWNLTIEPVKNPILDLSVKEIDLGDVTRATTADKTIVKIGNTGNAPLEVKASSDQPVLTVSPEQMSLDPSGSQKLVVRFVGTAIPANEKGGAKTAAIRITSNDPTNPTVSVPVKWNLTSEPVKTPALTLSVTEIDLGNVTRTTTLDKTVIKIGNTGNAPMDVKVSTDQPPLSVSPEQVTIDAGGTQKLAVRFVGAAIPPREEAGAKTGVIRITSNDPSNPTVSVPVKWNLTNEPVKNPVKVAAKKLAEKPVKASTKKQSLSQKEKPGAKQKRGKPKQ